MHSNPMRVLDSKNPDVQTQLVDAPALTDFVSAESQAHYEQLKQLLDKLNINYVENPKLVRGLDYYNNCVFEWTTEELGAQGAVCGGGRYDGLVAQLGGKPTFACGFAMGIERLVLMLDELNKVPASALKPIDVFVLAVGDGLSGECLSLAAEIRERHPELGVVSHCGGGKYNSQLKRAFSAGASAAVILERDADSDSAPSSAKIRRLDDSGETETVELSQIAENLAKFL